MLTLDRRVNVDSTVEQHADYYTGWAAVRHCCTKQPTVATQVTQFTNFTLFVIWHKLELDTVSLPASSRWPCESVIGPNPNPNRSLQKFNRLFSVLSSTHSTDFTKIHPQLLSYPAKKQTDKHESNITTANL